VIQAHGLVKRYGPVLAVDHLDLEVRAGETFALIGPNGAGKSTTLRMLLGLTRPNAGRIALGPRGLAPHQAEARRALGCVPQRVEFPPGRTVAEVLGFFAALRALPAGAVDRALARVGLAPLAGRRARELSGGFTQRLSLAQALLADPAILVLDEPTASLDPEATWEFRSLVVQLQREGKTILLSSHLLAEVERIADRVLILDEGRQAALESVTELRSRQAHATRLAIVVERDSGRALAALAARGLRGEALSSERLLVDAANGQPLAALEALRNDGVAVRSFEIHRPTLEEMFLAVVRRGRDVA